MCTYYYFITIEPSKLTEYLKLRWPNIDDETQLVGSRYDNNDCFCSFKIPSKKQNLDIMLSGR